MRRMRNWLLGSTLLFLTTLSCGAVTESPAAVNKKAEAFQVVLETSKGDIVLQLMPDKAPVTVNNFIEYVESGFYDGLVFHRVINDFMIQGGGFTPEMTQREARKPIKNESLMSHRLENSRGSIAMARTRVVDSATSQFFINLKDNAFLNGQPYQAGYAVFGQVIKGMDVVDSIGRVKTGDRGPYGDVPIESVIINKAFVVKEGGRSVNVEPKAS